MSGQLQLARRIFTNLLALGQYDIATGISKVNVVGAEAGQVHTELKIGPEHLNLQGTFHGAMAASLLDIATVIPLYVMNDKDAYLTVLIDVRFLNSAKLNDIVLMKSRVLKLGKSIAFTEAQFINKTTNKIILEGNQTHFVIKQSPFELLASGFLK